ncbi:MAG TPA: glycosyltransferase family 4 protein [Methanobacterium sp.]|nr:glycosyltransferase family 4 protein [Methanobacterium sp.]
MNNSNPKIIFVHNTPMWYRRPFFNLLGQIYDINFIFTHMNISKEIYGVELDNKIEGMENTNYMVIKNYFKIAWGAIIESFGNYDIFVGGSWDSLPEIVETAFYFTISKFRRKKFIIWSEDWSWKIKSRKRKLIKPFVRFIIKNSDAILVPGTKQKECTIYLGSKREKIFIMPNASNFSSEENFSIDIKNKLMIKNKKIILFVGRLVKQKGVDYLLKAFSRLKMEQDDIALVIIGTGEYEDELKEMVKDLKIEGDVYFLGQIDNRLLTYYYTNSEVCIVPSITDGMVDAWAFVVNEAMYCGKPVIATDAVGSAFDMIKNGKNGFIVPEKNSDALYDSMKIILSDEKLRKEMGMESKKIIEKGFKYENMIEGFSKAVEYVKNK